MNQLDQLEQWDDEPNRAVEFLDVDTRAEFITKTYLHLSGAIAGFVALIYVFMQNTASVEFLMQWPIVMIGGFLVGGWLASSLAHRVESLPLQYLCLAGYTALEAFLFTPLIYIALRYTGDGAGVLTGAAVTTLFAFAGLTMIAFTTRKDFSFLGGLLRFVGLCAIVAIVGGLIFGYTLGLWFTVAMIVFAGAAILYDTSNIIHHYPKDRYVAASLQLFSSVTLLFWYVLRLFIASDD